jgi:hypothetical protein
METYDEQGGIQNEGVWFQLKGTDKLVVVAKKRAIPMRMEWRDLLFWLNERMPGILVIYDAMQERAWWLHLQETLQTIPRKSRQHPAGTVTVHVPVDHILDEAAIRHFAQLRDAALTSRGDA